MSKENTQIPANGVIIEKEHTTIAEKLTYALYFFGQNIIFGIVTGILMLYYTDFAFIPIAATTILITVTKVWDAINDPIFGTIVDNMEMKSGKFKPWILLSSLLLPFVTIAMFAIPTTFSDTAKVVMAFITYLLWDIAYTISDVPAFAITTVMTDNIQERNKLINVNRVGAMFGIIPTMVLAPMLFDKFGPLKTVVPLAIIAGITMLPIAFVAKERFKAGNSSPESELDKKEGSSLKTMFTYLKSNKYLFIFYGATAIKNVLGVSLSNYIAIVIFGDLSTASTIGMIAMLPMILLLPIVPLLTKKFDKIVLYRAALVFSLVVRIIQFIFAFNRQTPPNLGFYIFLSMLVAIPEGLIGILMFTFTGDAVEYGHYVSGIRKEGITFSIQTFVAKLGAAGATALSALALLVIKYDAKATSYSTQFMTSLWNINFLVPFIGTLLALLVLFKYDMKVSDVQLMAHVNTGKMSEEDAAALMSKKYK